MNTTTRSAYPYQTKAIADIKSAFARGVRRLLFVMPTGAGKTLVACTHIVAELKRGKRILVIVDSRELVTQWYKGLKKAGVPASDIGTILAGDKRARPAALVQIATVQTLQRRLGSRPKADLVVIDEAHGAVAKMFSSIASLYGGCRILGLTATPWRLDGRGLGSAFDEMLIGPSTLELIAGQYLARPDVWSIARDRAEDLTKGIPTVQGDFDHKKLEKRVSTRRIVGSVVEHWLKLGVGASTVVYGVGRKHCEKIYKSFKANARIRKMGIAVEQIYANTPHDERDAILERMSSGAPTIVVTIAVLTKGWDCPAAKCCVFARPTKSLSLYLQIVGRFLRKYRGIQPTIIDNAGNVHRHGLPQQQHEWSLDGKSGTTSRTATGKPPFKYCHECGKCNEMHYDECLYCHAELPKDTSPDEIAADMVRVSLTMPERAAMIRRYEAALTATYKTVARAARVDMATRLVDAAFGDAQ